MLSISIQLPESIFSALRKEPDDFVKEMRLAASAKWYELGEISQEKAAEIAGVSRGEFIVALAKFKIDFMQYDLKDFDKELSNAN